MKLQVKNLWLLVFKVWVIWILFFGFIICYGYLVHKIAPGQFTRDTLSILEGQFYMGSLSNLGILIWTAAAALSFFCFYLLKKFNSLSIFKNYLFHFGLFTSILLLDDLYMWHEQMFPVYIGISESMVYLSYILYLFFILIYYRVVILKTDYLVLLAAFIFLGASVGTDFFESRIQRIIPNFFLAQILVEDSLKSMGIVTWLIYTARVAMKNVIPEVIAINSNNKKN
jgi:hypothetical protein